MNPTIEVVAKKNPFEQEKSFVDNMKYTLDQIELTNSRLVEGGFNDLVAGGPGIVYLREVFSDFISNPSKDLIGLIFQKLNSFALALIPIGQGAPTRENAENLRALSSQLKELSNQVNIFEDIINKTTGEHKFAPDVFAGHINQFCNWADQKSSLIDQYLS
jgi:hypothetical protein